MTSRGYYVLAFVRPKGDSSGKGKGHRSRYCRLFQGRGDSLEVNSVDLKIELRRDIADAN